jgi:hypothetical protein
MRLARRVCCSAMTVAVPVPLVDAEQLVQVGAVYGQLRSEVARVQPRQFSARIARGSSDYQG